MYNTYAFFSCSLSLSHTHTHTHTHTRTRTHTHTHTQHTHTQHTHTHTLTHIFSSSSSSCLLQIIHQRTTHTLSPFIWNMHPGGLNTLLSFSRDLSDFPFYSPSFIARSSSKNFTAIIMATTPAHRMDSPLVLLIKNLCSVPHLQAVSE